MRLELTIPLFAALFFIVWIGVLYVIAHLGPWSLLAQQFSVDEMTQGTRYWFASLQSGLASYRSCVNVIASEDRMTLSLMWPFRPFHPPITFPRSAVSEVSIGRFLLLRSVSFCVAGWKLRLYGSVVESAFRDD